VDTRGGARRGAASPHGTQIGLDLVEVERFERALVRHPRLEERVFTAAEIAYCRDRGKPVLHLAARFAAKEAVGKLLGTGVLCWHEIEVAGEKAGAPPTVRLTGRTAQRASELGVAEIRVSLSHVDSLAGACVVAVASSSEGAKDGRIPA
jgi:holo-[acyl-carrier protein] synthase